MKKITLSIIALFAFTSCSLLRDNIADVMKRHDKTPPVLAISSPNNGADVGGVFSLQGTVSDGVSGVDKVFYSVGANNYIEAVVTDGRFQADVFITNYGVHTNYVYAIDKAGNKSTVQSVNVEKTGIPSIVISSPINGFTTNVFDNFSVEVLAVVDSPYTITNITFEIYGSDDLLKHQQKYTINSLGGVFINKTFTAMNLTLGSNLLVAYAFANNGQSATFTNIFIIDTNAPTVPVISGDADSMNKKPTWSWNTIGDAVKYRYSFVDGSGWTETTDTNFTPTTNLSVGNHTLYVQAKDLAGNWSASGSKTIVVLPIFTEINPGSLTGVSRSSIDLGDIDGDGDLDLILTGYNGSYVANIYTNNGSGAFTEINPGSLTGVWWGSIDLDDIDGDGDLDLILTGFSGSYNDEVSKIYQNDGSGAFTEINPGSLTAVAYSSIDLGDIDSDGDLDLILTGYDGSSYVSKIYTNNGSGAFTEINPGSLTTVFHSSIDLGDIDGDGDLDLILTGSTGSTYVSKIYTNNGSGAFTEINPGSLTGVFISSIKLDDIDGDGDLDLILTGNTGSGSGYVSKIYTNNGSGGFGEINQDSLTGVDMSSINLGDIDGDGDLDLILTGEIASDTRVSKIYTNNGSGGFGEINSNSLTDVQMSSIDLGDIDGDGDLDLILTGLGNAAKIYRNNTIN